ncbi:hypothetical protein GVAV_003510 [Gurleya vavrai]
MSAWKTIQSLLAETAASFIFGFAVYSSTISSAVTEQTATPIIVGLAIALSAVAIIYAFCDIAPAHFNPAITLAAMFFGKINFLKGIFFIICQFVGFMIASLVTMLCYPGTYNYKINTIRPKKANDLTTTGNLICTEAFLTGILVFIAFMAAINPTKIKKEDEKKEDQNLPQPNEEESDKPDKKNFAPLTIGFTLGFLAFLGFSSSGGVYNPGLVLAPVLFSGKWVNSWAYWIAQFGGGIIGGLIQVLFFS